MLDTFWATIDAQLAELKTAKTADDVLRILAKDRNPNGHDTAEGGADGFFAGSGGDEGVDDALTEAGWTYLWACAGYWWAMQAPDGSAITYVEGDIYRGDRRPK